MIKLGVNIDHVATVRESRRTFEPDPVEAARLCEKAGCDSIVCHLREDRRHIQDNDVRMLRRTVRTRLNLEMSVSPEIVDIACAVGPDQVTLVPERRKELTTEGGLDVVRYEKRIAAASNRMIRKGIEVSVFVDPDERQIDAIRAIGVGTIEIHTGEYANAASVARRKAALKRIKRVSAYARELGMTVNAGHGLNYRNVTHIASIDGINELNIGHSIISRAILVGMERAVRDMIGLIR